MQTIEAIETIKYMAPPRRKRVKGGRPVLVQTRLTLEQAEKLDRLAEVYSEEGLPLTRAAVLAMVLDMVDKVEGE